MTPDDLRAICVANGIVVSLTDLVRERDAAKLLDVAPRTIRDWRCDGIGPRAIRLGGCWRYPLAELAAYLTPVEIDKAGETRQKEADRHVDQASRNEHDALPLAKKACAS